MRARLQTFLAPLLSPAGAALAALSRAGRPHRWFTDEREQLFYGYYDTSPFSPDDRYLLALRVPAPNRSPHEDHPPATLGFFDLAGAAPAFTPFAATDTWNWQQGCRLQWLGAGGDVIYNTRLNGQGVSAIQNIRAAAPHRHLPHPVYAVTADGAQALTLDFSHLHRFRPGYGYSNTPPADPDITLLDIDTGAARSILTLAEAADLAPLPSMIDASHYFNHLSFSPGGRRCMVMHLWLKPAGKRQSRILLRDMGGAWRPLPQEGRMSHYCWDGDDALIVFSAHGKNPGYLRHDLLAGTQTRIGGKNRLRQDGHPTKLPTGLLTDTYPDLFRRQHLLFWEEATRRLHRLASFHSPLHYTGAVRCDLHPRPNRAGTSVCVDAVRHGRRALCVIDLKGG